MKTTRRGVLGMLLSTVAAACTTRPRVIINGQTLTQELDRYSVHASFPNENPLRLGVLMLDFTLPDGTHIYQWLSVARYEPMMAAIHHAERTVCDTYGLSCWNKAPVAAIVAMRQQLRWAEDRYASEQMDAWLWNNYV